MPQIGVIQEQGDLGLGFNPVEDPEQQALLEQSVRKEREENDKKDD